MPKYPQVERLRSTDALAHGPDCIDPFFPLSDNIISTEALDRMGDSYAVYDMYIERGGHTVPKPLNFR